MTLIKDFMESIIGTYTPDLTAEGLAQVDWVWIASAVLLLILVASFFKAIRFILGGLKT